MELTYAGKVLVGIFAVLLLVFLLRPSMTGYATYRELQKQDLSADDIAAMQELLAKAHADLQFCNSSNGELSSVSSRLDTDLSRCQASEANMQTELNDLREEVETLSDALDDQVLKEVDLRNYFKENLTQAQVLYDQLAKSAAISICCKARVDDLTINSFSIENNKILCEVDGPRTLTCP
ncbi:MAG: hypothetical protein H6502_01985 [Candidatus Woesearchaeota archaeon]|nr:MAG: hypothetical protein H6502_01985 [Candidatus Woesearchaeota archaeon]